jgi:hypothetical protein
MAQTLKQVNTVMNVVGDQRDMKPSHLIIKICPTLKLRLKLAYKVLDTYLSTDEVKKCLESPKNSQSFN